MCMRMRRGALTGAIEVNPCPAQVREGREFELALPAFRSDATPLAVLVSTADGHCLLDSVLKHLLAKYNALLDRALRVARRLGSALADAEDPDDAALDFYVGKCARGRAPCVCGFALPPSRVIV